MRRSSKSVLYAAASLIALMPSAFAQAPGSIEEVVVTARKRNETLMEIPIDVTAFSQAKLDNLGVNTLQGLSAFTPGFDYNANTRVTPQIRFRGLGAITDTAASRTGAVFFDGSYVSDGVAILPLMDLDRVEVIKGPQTAYFGRNTFSGAVNFIPKEPGEAFSGKASASYSPSNQNSANFTGAVGVPITKTLGIEVAGMVERVGADWRYGNGDPNGQIDTKAISATMVFKPSDSLKFKATGFYVSSDDTIAQESMRGNTPAGQCNQTYSGNLRNVATGAFAGSFSTNLANSKSAFFCGAYPVWGTVPINMTAVGKFSSNPALFVSGVSPQQAQTLPVEFANRNIVSAPGGFGGNYGLWRLNLSADKTLPNDAVLSAIISRGQVSSWEISDANFGLPTTPSLAGFIRWTRDTSVETRYASKQDSRLRYMLGFNYYRTDIDASNLAARKALDDEKGENYGVFGSLDYDIVQQLTLSLEGRWNKDTQTILYIGPTGLLPTDPTPVTNVPQSYSKFMPRAILSFKPDERLNLYASFSRSYIQGISTNANAYGVAVPGSGISNATVGYFTPIQTLTDYEVGVKHRATDWMNYSIAGYYMKWTNQVFADLSPSFVSVNLPGDSRIYGVDMEAEIKPTAWFKLTPGLTYNNVRFTKFGSAGSIANAILAPGLIVAGVQIDSKGLAPRWIPAWSGSFQAEVQLGDLIGYQPGAFISFDGIYTGKFFVDNFDFNYIPGYWKFNVRAGAAINKAVSVQVYGNNLTNNLSMGTGSTSDTSISGSVDRKGYGTLPRTREVGIKLIANF